jgi:hypothetical protein
MEFLSIDNLTEFAFRGFASGLLIALFCLGINFVVDIFKHIVKS